ncbi:hypothetical protein AMR72_10870 [Flavobacterium psychrophilum]|nr:hypothetical protein AMR72_10870 [Flavobacterium psychrophilum]AOE52970.1 hypothetical protein ALW18_10860 [Flavobacterium psychrophilum]
MKKLLLAAVVTLLFSCSNDDNASVIDPVEENPEFPENCISDTGYFIKSQADVNLLAFSSICKIEGDLYIGSDLRSPASDITDLSGLSTIQEVTGKLVIVINNELQNLHGLENIKKVGALEIIDNSKLTSLEGLSIVEITGVTDSNNQKSGLLILRNDALTNLKGLENLTSVPSVKLSQNKALKDITALAGLESLPELELIENYALINLEGFNNLTNVGSIRLESNLLLNSLGAFDNLTDLGSFYCGGNPMLLSLKGFEKLTKINVLSVLQSQFTSLEGIQNVRSIDYLRIESNPKLNNIAQLDKLTSVHSVDLRDNQSLVSLQGLHNLKSCIYKINIQENNALTSVSALSSLESIDELEIRDCNALTSLQGLGAIKQINNLRIIGVPLSSIDYVGNIHSLSILQISDTQIASLSGLSGLTDLKIFTMYDNNNLTSLSGLENITSLTSLSISNCPNLTSIQALSNVDAFSEYFYEGLLHKGAIYITNTGLASLDALSNVTNSPSNLVIENNPELSNYCGLENLNMDTLEYVSIVSNQYNPTAEDIIAGNCAQ